MIRTFKSPPDSPFAIARDGEVYLRSVDWHETSTEGQRQQWKNHLRPYASDYVAGKMYESVIAAEKEAEQQRAAHDNG